VPRSVTEWKLSGDRADSRDVLIDSDASNEAREQRDAVVPKQEELKQAPGTQIMTIDDAPTKTAAAPASNPPRAASLLQRLISACTCGSRQGENSDASGKLLQ
jgi:hypothetical protein